MVAEKLFYFFLIRNEEEYINIRTDTGEIKETKEREKTKGRMRGPSYTNWTNYFTFSSHHFNFECL